MKVKMKIGKVLLYAIMLPAVSQAQSMAVTKLLLPDGKETTFDKVDSLKKAWNVDRVLFEHNADDDENHVMRLVPATPQIEKELEEAALKRTAFLNSLLKHDAPNFELKDINGKTWALTALKGTVVVLNFWFTSCPPCIAEMPTLNKLTEHYRGKKVVFLGLTFNEIKAVTAFLKQHTFNYNVLPASANVDKLYHITSWPTSIVIGRDGKVITALNYSEDIYHILSKSIDSAL